MKGSTLSEADGFTAQYSALPFLFLTLFFLLFFHHQTHRAKDTSLSRDAIMVWDYQWHNRRGVKESHQKVSHYNNSQIFCLSAGHLAEEENNNNNILKQTKPSVCSLLSKLMLCLTFHVFGSRTIKKDQRLAASCWLLAAGCGGWCGSWKGEYYICLLWCV